MKCFPGLLACLLLLILNMLQNTATSSIQTVVDTERAFSLASSEKGTRESFMEFIADDGVLFRPTAVNGKRWMRQNPLPPSSKRPLLTWQPVFADISVAGDMAYTTGPWQYKQDITDDAPVAFGNFVTVWRKQADGKWKFVIDLGISNPRPKEPVAEWQPKPGTSHKPPDVDVEAAKGELIKRDWEFSGLDQPGGMLRKFLSVLSPEVRLYRNDSYPVVGRDAAKEFLSTSKSVWTSQPDFADVSRSGDLGYTYGTYELKSNDAGAALIGKGNYLRIWKKQGSEWRIVVDVADPLPIEKKP